MIKRILTLAGIALLLLANLTACGVTSNTSPSASNSSSGSDAISEPVTLNFYNIARDSEEMFNDRMGNAIRKKFPNVTIKYVERAAGKGTDLAQYITTGEPIDIMWGSIGSWPGSVPTYNLQYDMTDFIKKYNVDINRIEPTLIDAMKQMSNGNIWGLPIENSTNVIIYNKDIFDKFGVEYPKDGMNWDELYSMAVKLNRESDGIQYTGYSPFSSYVVLMNQYSVPMIDPKTGRSTYDTNDKWPKIINAELMQFAMAPAYQKVAVEYRNNTLTPLLPDQFHKQKVLAMTEAGPLWPIVLKDQLKDINWDFVSMPTFKELSGIGEQSYPQYMSIANISKNKDAAMKVIKFLVSDEFQSQMSKAGNMTSLKSKEIQKLMGQDSIAKGKHYGAFFYNKFAPIADDDRILASKSSALNALDYGSIMSGKKDVNTMLRDAADKVNKAIDAQKN